jgi:hypothetical protein
LSVICNSDKDFGYDFWSYVAFYYQPVTDIKNFPEVYDYLPLMEIKQWVGVGTLPINNKITLLARQNIIDTMMDDIKNISKDIKTSQNWFKKHAKEIKKI